MKQIIVSYWWAKTDENHKLVWGMASDAMSISVREIEDVRAVEREIMRRKQSDAVTIIGLVNAPEMSRRVMASYWYVWRDGDKRGWAFGNDVVDYNLSSGLEGLKLRIIEETGAEMVEVVGVYGLDD